MRRDQLPPHKTATYVMPQYKAVYVSVPKAACTSLKWLVADLQRENGERFAKSVSREVSRAMCIHRRGMWRNTPMLTELTPEKLAAVSPDNGWFIFTVVRHPSARLFSGWQSKFLLREPRWVHELGHEPWFPRIPTSTEEVVEDFKRFVRSLDEDFGQAVARDRHFWRQADLVRPDRVPYSRIYKTSEIPQLLEEFGDHLRAQGWDGELSLRRSNETPLAPIAALFDRDVTSAVERLYGADFTTFGYEGLVPGGLEPDGRYPERAFAEIERLAERAERIGDLAMRAQALSEQLRAAKAASPSRTWRLRSAVRRVRRRLG